MSFFLAGGSLWWLVPAALGALALGIWAYRFAVPAVAPGLRRGLGILRVAALLLLLILLARPLLSLAERGDTRTVVVLEDVSLSMELPGDAAHSRAEQAKSLVEEITRRTRGRAQVQHWRFAGEARPASDTSRTVEPAATNLGGALRALSQVPDLVAVTVLSDGAATRGPDPVQAGRALGRPVSAVLLGEAPVWDAAVEEVAVSPLARLGEETHLEVRLTHTGEAVRRARLEVSDGATVLVARDITLAAGGEESVERVSFVPRRLGLLHYRVRLDAGQEEPLLQNNVRAAVQRVLPDRQRVLVLASALQWDWTWMKRAFDADSAYAVEYALASPQGFGLPSGLAGQRRPAEVTPLDRYAVVIVQGLAPERMPSGFEARLAAYVRGGGSLLLWGGPGPGSSSLGEWLGTPLGQAIALGEARERVPAEVAPALPADRVAADIVRLDDDEDQNRQLFSSLPPLSRVFPVAERPGDRVLLEGAGGRGRLMVIRRIGRGQVFFLNGAGLWRWGISSLDPEAPARYRRFWAQALRHLSEPLQTEPLRIAAERPLLSRGEPVRISASLQDAQFQPVPGAQVTARVDRQESLEADASDVPVRREVALADVGDGSYGGALEPLPPGRYRIEAQARSPQGVHHASAEFVVDSWTPEALAVIPDRAALQGLASATGGVLATPGQVDELQTGLDAAISRPLRWHERRLWEEPLLYAALLGLLGSEWWYRRRRGLP